MTSVAFSPDGRTLTSGSDDGSVRLWNVQDKTLVRTFEGHSSRVTSVAFSPDGRTLASGSEDNSIRLWNVLDKSLLHTFEGHTGPVPSVAFSPDGRTLASGSYDGSVRLWNVLDASLESTLLGGIAGNWLQLGPKKQVFRGDDGTLLRRRIANGVWQPVPVANAGQPKSLAVLVAQSELTTYNQDMARMWLYRSGTPVRNPPIGCALGQPGATTGLCA